MPGQRLQQALELMWENAAEAQSLVGTGAPPATITMRCNLSQTWAAVADTMMAVAQSMHPDDVSN